MTDNHYDRWDEPDCVRAFSEKKVEDFFRSETHFLDRIAAELNSVLDVGCAAGRMMELLRRYDATPHFSGIDISGASVELAKRNYPESTFVAGNALEWNTDERFDLVNATGVCQHEPGFEKLIERMTEWSDRYVLFDVKLAQLSEHLIDIDRAYCGGRDRLYYIVLALPGLLDLLTTLPGVSRISIFGYETKANDRTVLPATLKPLVSAGVLLAKSERRGAEPVVDLDLPGFLVE